MSLLKISEISKSYNDKLIIDNISFDVQEGEIISILGPSGVGKTTLFNVISSIEKADSGEVFYNGENVTGKVGFFSYMQQKDLLLAHKTVIDNVALPLVLNGEKKEDARKKASSYFKYFGLEGSENKYPKQLSGGMKQRVAFLRAFLYSNKLMLLDEPFSALDAITKSEIHEWYLNIVKKYKTTTIFVTHDVDEAIHLSDKIIIINGKPGKIAEIFEIDSNLMAEKDYNLTEKFITLKKQIIEKMI